MLARLVWGCAVPARTGLPQGRGGASGGTSPGVRRVRWTVQGRGRRVGPLIRKLLIRRLRPPHGDWCDHSLGTARVGSGCGGRPVLGRGWRLLLPVPSTKTLGAGRTAGGVKSASRAQLIEPGMSSGPGGHRDSPIMAVAAAWLVPAFGLSLVLLSLPPVLAQQDLCSPVSSGPEGEIHVGVRLSLPAGGGQGRRGGRARGVVSAERQV